MSLIHQSVSRVMKRSVLLIAAGVALLTTSAFAEEKVYRLTLAETWGPNFPIFGDTTKNMAAIAEKMSNGRLQIRIDSANKHKAPLGVFDMVKSGQYDMGHSIDALEWVGPSLDLRMGFHKIAPYYYTGWHEPATELQFLVNQKTWDKLPEDLREILRVAMRTAAYDMYVQSVHESGKNWVSITQEFPDVKVKTFPAPVIKALREVNDRLLAKHAAEDPLAKEIQESQANYLKQTRSWTDISLRAYLNSESQ
ncbi:hypothetical protein [Vibrio cholerae]|uniref:hypothetical protein n=1 Tax=Vibrio cholerae TaxID=666 RepID=UPI0006E539C5|nr:hypothetical protein [Vibrio cholerae]KQA29392.1 hypothetical protein F546_05795 [Vibrio paracholerae 877-163]MBJ6976128.1 hypothetical protein [Vibrio cholerae]